MTLLYLKIKLLNVHFDLLQYRTCKYTLHLLQLLFFKSNTILKIVSELTLPTDLLAIFWLEKVSQYRYYYSAAVTFVLIHTL